MVDFLRIDSPETRGPSSASIRRDQRALALDTLLASFFASCINSVNLLGLKNEMHWR